RCLFYMFWKIKKMLVSSTNIKKYRAKINNSRKSSYELFLLLFYWFVIISELFFKRKIPRNKSH
ncbi:hypothetical protein EGK22_02395, partial [Enterococcus faecium]